MLKCECCQKEKDNEEVSIIRLSEDDGFCKSSYSINICYDCHDKNAILTEHGIFVKIKNKAYFSDNSWGFV